MKKAALVWLRFGDSREVPAWCLWLDDAVQLVSGPGEQPVPGLAGAKTCEVVVRSSDNSARIVSWPATISQLVPGSVEWEATVPALAMKRLNSIDGPASASRWAAECVVSRLTPSGEPVEAGETLTSERLGAEPAPSVAATRTTVPYTVGRGRGRRQHRQR
jgi:hypothetical protein